MDYVFNYPLSIIHYQLNLFVSRKMCTFARYFVKLCRFLIV